MELVPLAALDGTKRIVAGRKRSLDCGFGEEPGGVDFVPGPGGIRGVAGCGLGGLLQGVKPSRRRGLNP